MSAPSPSGAPRDVEERTSTIISRLREAIDDPLAAVCTDHGGHRFPIPVNPETLAALLDVAEAAQRVYFVFGEGNGPLESLIHRNDLGELGAALQKLPQDHSNA